AVFAFGEKPRLDDAFALVAVGFLRPVGGRLAVQRRSAATARLDETEEDSVARVFGYEESRGEVFRLRLESALGVERFGLFQTSVPHLLVKAELSCLD